MDASSLPPNPLELTITSLVRLARRRAIERDAAIRERDTLRELLSVALLRLHTVENRVRRQQQQMRAYFGLDDEQQQYVRRGAAPWKS